MESCILCPHHCKVNRLDGQTGRCGLGSRAVVSTAEIHTGEEPPLVTGAGSGTVFLSGCIASCCFCQNYQISRLNMGQEVSTNALANTFLTLQEKGCTNLNWVTPTPHLPMLLKALAIAIEAGLSIPLVYNCNGYMSLRILKMLDGIVDIYLPDMKYGQDLWAEEFSGLKDYPAINFACIEEMYRQVGLLQIDANGAATTGLLVRHLVLPEKTAGTEKVLQKIADINPRISISLMAQYRPCHEAIEHSIIGRPLFQEEYVDAVELLEIYGLTNAFIQSPSALQKKDGFFPDFTQETGAVFDQD